MYLISIVIVCDDISVIYGAFVAKNILLLSTLAIVVLRLGIDTKFVHLQLKCLA